MPEVRCDYGADNVLAVLADSTGAALAEWRALELVAEVSKAWLDANARRIASWQPEFLLPSECTCDDRGSSVCRWHLDLDDAETAALETFRQALAALDALRSGK